MPGTPQRTAQETSCQPQLSTLLDAAKLWSRLVSIGGTVVGTLTICVQYVSASGGSTAVARELVSLAPPSPGIAFSTLVLASSVLAIYSLALIPWLPGLTRLEARLSDTKRKILGAVLLLDACVLLLTLSMDLISRGAGSIGACLLMSLGFRAYFGPGLPGWKPPEGNDLHLLAYIGVLSFLLAQMLALMFALVIIAAPPLFPSAVATDGSGQRAHVILIEDSDDELVLIEVPTGELKIVESSEVDLVRCTRSNNASKLREDLARMPTNDAALVRVRAEVAKQTMHCGLLLELGESGVAELREQLDLNCSPLRCLEAE